jgi:hypothetical protein
MGTNRRGQWWERGLVALAVGFAVVLALPGVAGAAFPGSNGLIVYQSTQPSTGTDCPVQSTQQLFIALPGSPSTPTDPDKQLDCTGAKDEDASFSPDGSEIVFASNRQVGGNSNWQLYTEAFNDDGTASDTPALVHDQATATTVDSYPSFAPASPGNQNTIIFARQSGPYSPPQLYTVNLTNPNSLAPVFPTQTGFADSQPVYDPSNGNEIAFARTNLTTGYTDIVTYNFVTHALTDLSAANGDTTTHDSKPDFAPSPDSYGDQLIVFQSDRPSPCNTTELYTMTDQAPASPAQSTISPVFQNTQSVQVCPTGGSASPVALENPVYSPDGAQIAFDQFNATQQVFTTWDDSILNTSAQSDVARMSGETDLTPNTATDEAPTWGPVEPGVSTPEAPLGILLPLSATALLGAAVVYLRQRKRPVDA